MKTNLQHYFETDYEFRQMVITCVGWSKWQRAWTEDEDDIERWLMAPHVEAEEPVHLHDWECDTSMVLTTYPPRYGWKCRKCGDVTTWECGKGSPPAEGCKFD